MTLTVGSLFSGIGGLDLGLERAGMRVIWQSEIDPYACKVLSKHWPEVVNHGDIKKINWQEVERPDVICGGYPCQPFSTAGKRRGEEDPRHLWPWVREAISELRPRYAILENVRGHLSMGGLSVIAELASIGYDAEWRIVSAASVGANHRRDRIIIVAYPNNTRPHRTQINTTDTRVDAFCGFGRCCEDVADPNSNNSTDGRQCSALQSESASGGNDRSGSGSNTWQISMESTRKTSSNMANTDGERLEKQRPEQQTTRTSRGDENTGELMADADSSGWQRNRQSIGQEKAHTVFTSSSTHRSWNEIATNWQTEPDVGRVADGVPARVDRLKGLGNAVVPQVAEVIGRLVIAHAG